MSVFEEVKEYKNRWICLTGCSPSAVPLTTDECNSLAEEFFHDTLPCFVLDRDAVPSVIGMDIYITPDAPFRRTQVRAMK